MAAARRRDRPALGRSHDVNIVLIVVDSMRARSLHGAPGGPATPFFDRLDAEAISFRHAFATECWTLPSHLSMFTGLLPSEHGAHFQNMAYRAARPTIAELLAQLGYATEVVTRNPQFDGTTPGATRGFATNTRLLAGTGLTQLPLALTFALQKPRLRRMIAAGGWYSLLQRHNAEFLAGMVRVGLPADHLVLDHLLGRMAEHRRHARRYFLFANLFDVHAPYGGGPQSLFSPMATRDGWLENLAMRDLCRIQSHDYLRPGFHMTEWSRHALLRRYHRGITYMSDKLGRFFAAAQASGLLDDTMVIVTADHGEAFGEHDLFYHDASVYNVHLHVPLWILHPERRAAVVDDTVSTAELFGLMRAVGTGGGTDGTLLDARARAQRGVALAEHYHSPRVIGVLPQYAQNIATAIVGPRKAIVRREGLQAFDLGDDPHEQHPVETSVAAFEDACRRDGAAGAAIRAASDHLRRWEVSAAAA
jgi:hypothetical protein